MLCDKELMLKGFNVHGVFYNQNSQVVLTEAPIIFDSNNSVSGLSWSLSTPDQIKILEDGVYKIFLWLIQMYQHNFLYLLMVYQLIQ